MTRLILTIWIEEPPSYFNAYVAPFLLFIVMVAALVAMFIQVDDRQDQLSRQTAQIQRCINSPTDPIDCQP